MLSSLINWAVRLRLVLLPLAALGVAVAWYLGSPLFINQTVNEGLPTSATAESGRAAATRPASTEPVVLAAGQFGEIDSIHRGAGQAVLFRLPDGPRVLRFEEFRVTNGPDLFVYLSGHPAPRNSEQLHQGGAFEVARLKGNIGSQNYELPADLDLSRFRSAVIYCKRFSVVFSTAELLARL